MLQTFIGTYIPDFNSIPSAVLEKKFLESHMVAMLKTKSDNLNLFYATIKSIVLSSSSNLDF
jgi:hypothetical protein